MGSDEETQNFVSNISNTKAAERLQEIVGDKSCPNHLYFENLIELDLSDGQGEKIGTILQCCCEGFQPILNMLVHNKIPSDWNK